MVTDILSFIRDTFGARVFVPILLLVVLGAVFSIQRGYPLKELFYDRWFLICVIAVVSGSLVYFTYTSNLAERTPEGRFGVYIARIGNDPDRSLHIRLMETLVANLDGKAKDAGIRLEFKDLKSEITDQEIDRLPERTRNINATIVIWGMAIQNNEAYLRLWTKSGEISRSPKPVTFTDINQLAEFATQVWERIDQARLSSLSAEERKTELEKEVAELKADVAKLRELMTSSLVVRSATDSTAAANLITILIGVGEYSEPGLRLFGPANDVAALRQVLVPRTSQFKILLDKEATKQRIEETVKSTAQQLPSDIPLLVYFSGHSMTDKANNTYSYIPYDYNSQSNIGNVIELRALIIDLLKSHHKSIVIVDGHFDPSSIPKELTSEAAIISAAVSTMAFETTVDGKPQGLFTAALVKALAAVPSTIPINIKSLFSTTKVLLKQSQSLETDPTLVVGANPPSF